MVILGDRWELFAASLPAFLHGIPLVHISGGEVTEGVIDDSVRHAHSKLSHLHFVANGYYADNLSRMGEEDWRITLSGECGIDTIHHQDLATVDEIKSHFGIDLGTKPVLLTFHPPTLDGRNSPLEQFEQILAALDCMPYLPVVMTAPGVEQGAQAIVDRLATFARKRRGAHFVPHLGRRNYLTVMKNACIVLGNSSSGLVEAASFGVPAVDVGDRQKNRLAAESVIHTPSEVNAIYRAMVKALDPAFQHFSRTCPNPYDPYRDGRNSERIVHAIDCALSSVPRDRLLLKRFDPVLRPDARDAFLKDFQ
jgi:UDP-hydrolysing UDP-N-acetyl-D-glucosamine 2-epimerase